MVNSADSGAVKPRILEPRSSTKEFSKSPNLSDLLSSSLQLDLKVNFFLEV